MNYGEMFGEIVDDRIQKMASLIAGELDRTTKLTPNVLIQEFGRGSHGVVKSIKLYIIIQKILLVISLNNRQWFGLNRPRNCGLTVSRFGSVQVWVF